MTTLIRTAAAVVCDSATPPDGIRSTQGHISGTGYGSIVRALNALSEGTS